MKEVEFVHALHMCVHECQTESHGASLNQRKKAPPPRKSTLVTICMNTISAF